MGPSMRRRRPPSWASTLLLLLAFSLGGDGFRQPGGLYAAAEAAMAGPPIVASKPSSTEKTSGDAWTSSLSQLGEIHNRLKELSLSAADMRDLREFMAQRTRSALQGGFDMDSELQAFMAQREVLLHARELRQEGNNLLSDERLEEARAKYSEALELVQAQEAEVQTRATRQAGHSCLLSLAVCDLRQGDLESAELVCSSILEDQPSPRTRMLTLSKRARALLRMDEVDRAKADLSEANRLDPTNTEVADELRELGGEPVPPPPPPSLTASPTSMPLFGGQGLPGAGASPLAGLAGLGGLGGLAGLAGPGAGGDVLMKGLLGNLGPRLLEMVEKPETLNMICRMANGLDASRVRALAQQAGLPIGEQAAGAIGKWATGLRPEHVQRYIKWGKRTHGAFRTSKAAWARASPWVSRTRRVLPYILLLRWIAACIA